MAGARILLLLPQLPQDPSSGAARTAQTAVEMAREGGFEVPDLDALKHLRPAQAAGESGRGAVCERLGGLRRPDTEEKRARLLEMIRIPLGRYGAPEDIAAAVVFMASPAAGWVTGQCLFVTGGL